jgi:magnesium transporter
MVRDNPEVDGTLLLMDGSMEPWTLEGVEAQLAAGTYFWLDLIDAHAAAGPLLLDTFKFHPLAVEDSFEFGQRPKIDGYDDFAFLSIHGAKPDGSGTVEVHCFISHQFLVTVRRGPCESIDEVRRRFAARFRDHEPVHGIMVLYRIADGLVDSFLPVLSSFDDRIDELEDAILLQPTNSQLGELFEMKQALVHLRKVVTPQRDLFSGVGSGLVPVPGMNVEAERYFRDVYDHLIRISDLVDSYRDLLSGAMDTHLSVTSNRLNQVMKQLTIIATVFMPLTFLTGFFGQNFAWLVQRIGSGAAFWAVGVGAELVALVLLYMFMRRRHWLG